MSIEDGRNGGKWDIGVMGSVTAGHNKFDALELRILLYLYFKSWDHRGDPLYVGLSNQSRALCESVCHQCGAVLTVTESLPRDFGSFSMELLLFWWNHRINESLPKLSGQSAAEPTHRSAGEQWPVWEGTRVKNYHRLALKSWAPS